MVAVDAVIFCRVLDNLLSNAIKFSPFKSQVTLRGEYLAAGGAKVQVADSGSGFEKDEIGTPMSEVPQIGLELAFCKMAIEAHSGTALKNE